MLKNLCSIALIVFLMLGSLWGVTIYRGRESLEVARRAKSSGNVQATLEAYQAAIAWRSPLNPYPRTAFQELAALEATLSDTEKKREALLLLKSGLRSSRSFLLSKEDESVIAEIDNKISQLNGTQSVGGIKEVYPPRISYIPQGIAQIFFWLWIASVLHLIWQGFGKEGRIRKRGFLEGLAGTLVTYVLWIVALSWA